MLRSSSASAPARRPAALQVNLDEPGHLDGWRCLRHDAHRHERTGDGNITIQGRQAPPLVDEVGVQAMAHRHLGHRSARRCAFGQDLPLQFRVVAPARVRLGVRHGVHLSRLVDTILAGPASAFKMGSPDAYVASYDLTTASMNRDWGAVAEMGGGLLGGFALGKATSAYGKYGVKWAPGEISSTPMSSQRGATSLLNFELVRPSSRPSLGELRVQYGVNVANLAVEATFYHQGKLFYDVNQTARNSAWATDDRLPIYSESRARLGDPNQTRGDAHAEVGAMGQSYDSGMRGGSATLTILGKDACSYCMSDVKKWRFNCNLMN